MINNAGASHGKKNVSKARDKKEWNFRLYVAGKTPKSIMAFANLQRICEEHLAGECSIEISDLLENSQLAREDQILAIPTLMKKFPGPVRRIIGDLSNTKLVLVGLDLQEK